MVRRAHRQHAAAHGSGVDRRAVVAGLDGRDDRDAGLDDRDALTVPSPPRPFVSLNLIYILLRVALLLPLALQLQRQGLVFLAGRPLRVSNVNRREASARSGEIV